MTVNPNDPLGYIALDPGKTVGYATFSISGKNLTKGQLDWLQVGNFLALAARNHIRSSNADSDSSSPTWPKLTVICEEYRIRSGMDQRANMWVGNTFETVQVIGMVRMFSMLIDAELVFQPANILPVAAQWTGVAMPTDHRKSHWVSAYNHGQYYLIKNRINPNPKVAELRAKREAVLAEIEADKLRELEQEERRQAGGSL